jgi:hypothetical protein
MSDTSDFDVTVRLTADDCAVVAISGDLDLFGVARLRRGLLTTLHFFPDAATALKA